MARDRTMLKRLFVVALSLFVLAVGTTQTAEAQPGPKKGNSKQSQGSKWNKGHAGAPHAGKGQPGEPHAGKGHKSKPPKHAMLGHGPKASSPHHSGKPKHVVVSSSDRGRKPTAPHHSYSGPGKGRYSHKGGRVYVHRAPPAPRYVHVHPRPRTGYVWVEGYWDYDYYYDQWVWVDGYWARARRGMAFKAGHWQYTPDGWLWISHRWM